MALTSHQLAEVVSYIREARTRGAVVERRRASRVPAADCKIALAPLRGGTMGKPFTVMTRDLCVGGAGILTGRAMRVGEMFVVRLPKGGRDAVHVVATTIFCDLEADGIYKAGLRFSRVMEAPPNAEGAPTEGGVAMAHA